MGCFQSAVGPDPDGHDGGSVSVSDFLTNSRHSVSNLSVEWVLLPTGKEARLIYEADETLNKNCPESHLELRTMLDEHAAVQVLGKYAKSVNNSSILRLWIDIEEYKRISPSNSTYMRSKARDIGDTYIKLSGVCSLPPSFMDAQKRVETEKVLSNLLENSADLETSLHVFFIGLQQKCFLAIHDDLFLKFTSTDMYTTLCKKLDQKYNKVSTDDFTFHKKLGEGGFGIVFECEKKTTGVRYAMKIQKKKEMLKSVRRPMDVCNEKKVIAACQHPFIVGIAYAFQTEALGIMVMDLSLKGDLFTALNRCENNRFDEDRTRIYTAEILLAIDYLHQQGLIYRDLKPNNVLVGEDGHILLLDMGGVADLDKNSATSAVIGKTSLLLREDSTCFEKPPTASIGTNISGGNTNNSKSKNSSEDISVSSGTISNSSGSGKKSWADKREFAIVGTLVYMSPEMIIMLHQQKADRDGYTQATDWWSLGVTVYRMLTGCRPFDNPNFNTFIDMTMTMERKFTSHVDFNLYAKLFQKIDVPSNMELSEEAFDFITRLLDVNEHTRLGSGPLGVEEMKNHPFFKGIDWSLLEHKHIKAPEPILEPVKDLTAAVPENIRGATTVIAARRGSETSCEARNGTLPMTFEEIMADSQKAHWITDEIDPNQQQYFQEWDFTAPKVIKVEAGLSHVVAQYEQNSKLKKMIGEVDVKAARAELSGNVKQAGINNRKIHLKRVGGAGESSSSVYDSGYIAGPVSTPNSISVIRGESLSSSDASPEVSTGRARLNSLGASNIASGNLIGSEACMMPTTQEQEHESDSASGSVAGSVAGSDKKSKSYTHSSSSRGSLRNSSHREREKELSGHREREKELSAGSSVLSGEDLLHAAKDKLLQVIDEAEQQKLQEQQPRKEDFLLDATPTSPES